MRILLGIVAVLVAGIAVVVVLLKQPTFGKVVAAPPEAKADASTLETHVRMLSEDFAPRDYTHPDNLDAAAAYIAEQLRAAGAVDVVEQPYEVEGTTYKNVIASFGPDTPERVVVGAHYDVCEPFPGADDNASGVAGLLEIARMLEGVELKTRVELVAFSLEEPPFFRTESMGSYVHATSLKESKVGVRAMICLEMLGYFTDEKGTQEFPIGALKPLYPSKGNYIAIVGRFGGGKLVRHMKRSFKGANDLPVETINGPASIPGIDFSDHLNYWKYDWPAVMLTDTAFYRNQAYHTADDTADRLDYERMELVVDGVYNAVVALANHS